jgi:hypothetical protein
MVAGQVIDDISSLSIRAMVNMITIGYALGLFALTSNSITNYLRAFDDIDLAIGCQTREASGVAVLG